MLVRVITPIQLRAARAGLNLTVKQLSTLSGISSSTIQRIEKDNPNNQLYAKIETIHAITTAFKKTNKIEFLGDDGIKFKL